MPTEEILRCIYVLIVMYWLDDQEERVDEMGCLAKLLYVFMMFGGCIYLIWFTIKWIINV